MEWYFFCFGDPTIWLCSPCPYEGFATLSKAVSRYGSETAVVRQAPLCIAYGVFMTHIIFRSRQAIELGRHFRKHVLQSQLLDFSLRPVLRCLGVTRALISINFL